MYMSLIEIALFVAVNTVDSVIPQLIYRHKAGRFIIPFNSILITAVLNLCFLSLYLWLMQTYTIAYYLIWALSLLGTGAQVCGYLAIVKSCPRLEA